MPKAKIDGERHVRDYPAGLGLQVKPFTKAEMKNRTPDFRVFRDGDLVFYCEVKTAQKDEWLEGQLAMAAPGTIVGGGRPDPVYNRLSAYIHSAVGQFDSVNPSMRYPNVLAIFNADESAGRSDLISVITGDAYCESGEVIPMFREYSEGRIRKEKLRVHLYLWFDEWEPIKPKMYFPDVHVVHHAALCRYFHVDPAAMKRI